MHDTLPPRIPLVDIVETKLLEWRCAYYN